MDQEGPLYWFCRVFDKSPPKVHENPGLVAGLISFKARGRVSHGRLAGISKNDAGNYRWKSGSVEWMRQASDVTQDK